MDEAATHPADLGMATWVHDQSEIAYIKFSPTPCVASMSSNCTKGKTTGHAHILHLNTWAEGARRAGRSDTDRESER